MQRCPKCGRTYETDTQKFCTHDGGRLAFDDTPPSSHAPTAYDLNQTVSNEGFDPEATVTRMPDLNKTVTSLPTSEIRSKDTGPAVPPPSGPYQQAPPAMPPSPPAPPPTISYVPSPPPQPQHYQQPPAQQMPPQQMPPPAQPPQGYPAHPSHAQAPHSGGAPRKSSRIPLIIGLVVVLLIGGAAAWYFLIYKKNNASANANSNSNVANANSTTNSNGNSNSEANTNTTTPPTLPPENATEFVNSSANLDGKLAEKFSDFSFYYPNNWELDPKSGVAGASNFVRVERQLPPDFTQENFTVSWYDSKGTFDTDKENVFPKLVESLKSRLSKSYPEFKALSEGQTTINGIKGYEFRFESVSRGTEKGDITLWGRVVFLPPGKDGETNGIQLLMLTSSLAPELKSADDVGVKGELPVILNSFKTGNSK